MPGPGRCSGESPDGLLRREAAWLTKRRAVDLCRVATCLCRHS